uniref:Uncharacterized protein n=1 Tax=Rhizophora mucronata TaxID=61149 RepID=A0A2P2J8S8_RHIMU
MSMSGTVDCNYHSKEQYTYIHTYIYNRTKNNDAAMKTR